MEIAGSCWRGQGGCAGVVYTTSTVLVEIGWRRGDAMGLPQEVPLGPVTRLIAMASL
jgi:hypothetical protein